MWPPTEMKLDNPNVSSRLMISTPRTGLLRMLMPRLRPASTAPIRPKMAPEAPHGEGVKRDDQPPASHRAGTRSTTPSWKRPTDFSIRLPRIRGRAC